MIKMKSHGHGMYLSVLLIVFILPWTMGLGPFYGKGPQALLWAGLQATCGKLTVNAIPNCLDYCKMFVLYAQFTNVPVGHITQPGGPCLRLLLHCRNHCFFLVLPVYNMQMSKWNFHCTK